MNWKPDKNKPICPQICERICVLIASGKYISGDKLPSVRELAVKIGVNPNTVQKSYEALENRGIIYTERNSGRYVGDNADIAVRTIEEQKYKKTKEYLSSMKDLGFDIDATKKYIKEWKYE